MSEQYRFFDSVDGEDERYYTADEFAEYFGVLLTSGVFNGGNNLKVVASETTTSVWVKEGYAWLKGYMYKIDKEPLVVELPAPDPILDRIDRLVIRLDKSLNKRNIKAIVIRGEEGENPVAPSLTRNENIYDISLAQIRMLAGKSFISENEVLDERLDESVCGIVNSLIGLSTSDFLREWNEWMTAMADETYIPKKNFKDGFIKTANDLIYSIPDKKLCIEEGWPTAAYLKFENTSLDDENNIYINSFYDNGNLCNNHISKTDATTGYTINDRNWVAVPFILSEESDSIKMKIYMSVDSHYHPTSKLIIYKSNSEGLPDIEKEIYSGTLKAPYPYNGNTVEMDINLENTLEKNREYIAVIKGSYDFTWSNLRSKVTPGIVKLYESKDSGTSWTGVERTPFLEINGIKREGSVTITHLAEDGFKTQLLTKHLLVDVDMIGNINSNYKIDIYDLTNNLIIEDVKKNESLFESLSNIYKGIKVKISLSRLGLENPKLLNYKYIWISDISRFEGGHAIKPSDSVIEEYLNELITSSAVFVQARSFIVSRGGRYRLTGELKSSPYYSSLIEVYLNQMGGNRLGYFTVKSETFRSFSIDLDSVPPNSKIIVAFKRENANAENAVLRNIKICGSLGYQYK